MKEVENIVDFKSTKALKDFVSTANERILALEHALYTILETDRIDVIKEIAADVLGEDLDIYLEEDIMEELDFEDESKWTFANGDEDER